MLIHQAVQAVLDECDTSAKHSPRDDLPVSCGLVETNDDLILVQLIHPMPDFKVTNASRFLANEANASGKKFRQVYVSVDPLGIFEPSKEQLFRHRNINAATNRKGWILNADQRRALYEISEQGLQAIERQIDDLQDLDSALDLIYRVRDNEYKKTGWVQRPFSK